MSAFLEETRRDRDADWEPNPPPSPSPLLAAATRAMPELLRALEPFVNHAATDLAQIGTTSRPLEGSVAPLEVTTRAFGDSTIDAAQFDRFAGALKSRVSMQGALLGGLDAVRPRLAEPQSLFPSADYSSGGNGPAATGTHACGRIETGRPDDFAGAEHSARHAALTQTPLGDARALEGRLGGSSTLDGAGTEAIAELVARLLQAATRLEHLAQRTSSDTPRPYRSTPWPFRDRVEG